MKSGISVILPLISFVVMAGLLAYFHGRRSLNNGVFQGSCRLL